MRARARACRQDEKEKEKRCAPGRASRFIHEVVLARNRARDERSRFTRASDGKGNERAGMRRPFLFSRQGQNHVTSCALPTFYIYKYFSYRLLLPFVEAFFADRAQYVYNGCFACLSRAAYHSHDARREGCRYIPRPGIRSPRETN